MFKLVFLTICSVMLFASACGNDDATCETDTDDIGDTDGPISEVTVKLHGTVNTVLVVSWSQNVAADEVFLRYTFENGEWYESPPKTGEIRTHFELILGVPEEKDVTFHIVWKSGDNEQISDAFQGTTGSLPAGIPHRTVDHMVPANMSPNRWVLGSVDAGHFYEGPFWVFIMDRQGRIVWYYADIANNPIIGFPRISTDGRYIYFGNRTPWSDAEEFVPKVIKMTLGFEYYEEIEMPLSDNVDMTDDGSLLFNTLDYEAEESWLVEYLPDGTFRDIWDCETLFSVDDCYSNTVNWNPLDDTVLMSFPYINAVVEIDRQTGEVVGQYGEQPGSYAFDSDLWGFDFPHYANITPEGTLMVSSHVVGAGPMHAFMEFEIDRDNEVLKEKWIYREGEEWADAMGEAHPIPNSDNVLANYGTDGVIREITPDKQTVWRAHLYTLDEGTVENHMVGHCTLIDDLYALNRGPE